ncbi:MAG: leucine--tRNA ligase [Patescibacteria group bacterium]
MQRYTPKDIETKWQDKWEADKIYQASEDPAKPKKYVLEYFPYPSGAAMHVGHVRNYTIGDAVARFGRMTGHNVLHPMGWDAFGLPAENYAIKTGNSPKQIISDSTSKFKKQLMQMGFSYDWSREINSSDPNYYKWTQWFFLMLFNKGLAYQQEALVNWDPVDKTVLANEQVIDGKAERSGAVVEKKSLKQWFFKITDYADRLLEDLDDLDWSDAIKSMQRNWIGRSVGAEVEFAIDEKADYVLLHGYTGTPEETFFPVLRKKIESLGHKVYAPQLPNTDNPTIMEQVEFVRDNYEFTENSILLGQSLGSPVALKVVEGLSKPIKKLVIVCGFAEPKFVDKKRPFEQSFDWQFDFDKIKQNVEQIVILRDKNDTLIPPERAQFLLDKLGGTLVDFDAEENHACGPNEPVVIENTISSLKVFTTRPDTLFGATFMVLAPEHPLVKQITTDGQKSEVEAYIKAAGSKSEIERQDTDREKTGVFTGAYAINPVNQAKVPIWIADYVLAGYGTGAIMAVPAHDERDFAFAKKFELPIVQVIKVSNSGSDADNPALQLMSDITTKLESAYVTEGEVCNSGDYDGISSAEMREKIVQDLEKSKTAREVVNYKIRDWLISRQRYWGAPIPIIHCPTDGAVAVPEDQLPVVLPEVESYEPSGDGRSPLANVEEFVNTTCPKCGGPAERETDTMDGFACSSWYFLRFADPHNDKVAFDKDKAKFWLPVDDYIGGAEHAVMHLLYARFWTKVMYDEGLIEFSEPFAKLRNQGMILAPDGNKMSKSKGNTIEPDGLIEQGYGADSIRIMELFVGPWNQAANWSVEGMGGAHRFLQRTWTLVQEFNESDGGSAESAELKRSIHATIKKVTQDLGDLSFNTAIAALMECVNELYRIKAEDKYQSVEWQWGLESLLQLLAPFAPHIAEELWQQMGQDESIHTSEWPTYDEKYLVQDSLIIAVQVNGKLRGEIQVAAGVTEEAVVEAAQANDKVAAHLNDQTIRKTIYVPNKLVNFVI